MKTSHQSHSLVPVLSVGARAAFCLLLAGLPAAFAQANNNSTPPPPAAAKDGFFRNDTPVPAGELARADRRFFQKAAKLGEREVMLSRAAGQHAMDARVRSFAEEMVREHTRANEQIAELARRKGAMPESADATERRAEAKKWAEKKAGDFDKDYLSEIIDAHEDTVDVLENGSESKDPEIAALASRLLPDVKSHLARAEALEDALD